MPTTEQWPGEIHEMAKGVTRFKPVTATVKSVVERKDGTFWGWKFAEDTTKDGEYTGVVWGAPQEWDDQEKAYLEYEGPTFSKGTVVRAELSTKTAGNRTYYNVRNIFEAVESAEAAPPAANQDVAQPGATPYPAPVPAEWSLREAYWREKQAAERASIQAQTAFNGLVALLKEGAPNFDTGELDRMKFQLNYILNLLVPGLPGPPADTVEDLPWEPTTIDGGTVPQPRPTQPVMDIGAAGRAAH